MERLSYADISDCLNRNGISTIELEYLAEWFAHGEARARANQVRNDLFEAADALQARHIKIVPPFGNAQYEMSHLAGEFSALCGQAAQHGVRVALEMIPFSDIATLQAAQDLVTQAGSPNGGILVDIWHLHRSGGTYTELSRVPTAFLMAAELCDAEAVPNGELAQDSMHHRKFCGEGAFSIPEFITAMGKAGYQGPYGVEILSDDLRKLPLQTAATESYRTTRAMWSAPSP